MVDVLFLEPQPFQVIPQFRLHADSSRRRRIFFCVGNPVPTVGVRVGVRVRIRIRIRIRVKDRVRVRVRVRELRRIKPVIMTE